LLNSAIKFAPRLARPRGGSFLSRLSLFDAAANSCEPRQRRALGRKCASTAQGIRDRRIHAERQDFDAIVFDYFDGGKLNNSGRISSGFTPSSRDRLSAGRTSLRRLEFSGKASENWKQYTRLIAENATAATQRQRGRA
jgi:hypothetical protein